MKEFHSDCHHYMIARACTQWKSTHIALLLQVDKAYRNILNKFSEERRKRQDCEGEYGLYYRPERAEQNEEEEEEEEENIKVRIYKILKSVWERNKELCNKTQLSDFDVWELRKVFLEGVLYLAVCVICDALQYTSIWGNYPWETSNKIHTAAVS